VVRAAVGGRGQQLPACPVVTVAGKERRQRRGRGKWLPMSSRTEKKNACSAARNPRNRPYDNRPRSGPVNAKQRTPRKTDEIRVDLPDEPPTLTPEAARALLRILLKAHDRLLDKKRPTA
jgi:hypothetical protein